MAHKTLIDGTAYEISGGKTLIDGVAYSIDKGKTLVGGTAYEVGFGQLATITVIGDSDGLGYIEHNGIAYDSAATFTANIGDTIYCYVGDADYYGIVVNNESAPDYECSHTVISDTVIVFDHAYVNDGEEDYSECYILVSDENGPPPATITVTGDGHPYRCYIEHERASGVGSGYYESEITLIAHIGDKIICDVRSNSANKDGAEIIVNGASMGKSNSQIYTHTVGSNATINLNYRTEGSNYWSTITITEANA